MKFATRTFLWSFVPLAIVLAVSFVAVRAAAGSAVRDNVQQALRTEQEFFKGEHLRSDQENSRLLKVVTENSALKAGIQILITEMQARDAARSTVEDQLSELAAPLGFDFVIVSGVNGQPLAGIQRQGNGFVPANLDAFRALQSGFFGQDQQVFQVTSVPLTQGQETIGSLASGETFDLVRLPIPAVLTHDGRIVASAVPDLPAQEAAAALSTCQLAVVCEISVAGDKYLSLPLEITSQTSQPSGFHLRTLQNVSAASAPLQSALLGVFLTTGGVALLGMLGISLVSARSIVRPIASLVEGLRQGSAQGVLPHFNVAPGSVQEIKELMRGFNEAASAISIARQNLVRAYLEFVGSLAHALDARDPYTAGHSQRVSDYSRATADSMHLSEEELNTIQVGALLHDIGKIGIPDEILRKAGPLTPEEEGLIREHPVIGRRILEGVHGFEQYLSIVELHHENWDGTGYPHGLKGEAVPLLARIVKVADAYDAMTSDRPYRKGMSHDAALRILAANVGTQLDPAVLEAFAGLTLSSERVPAPETARDVLNNLADAMRRESGTSSGASSKVQAETQSETHEVKR